MRALAKCFLSLVLLVGIPQTVPAQILNQPDIPRPFPGQLLQFNEVVPPATEESMPEFSLPGTPVDVLPDLMDESSLGTIPDVEFDEGPPSPAKGDLDATIGQPFDLPVSDVLIDEGVEVFSTNNWFRGGRWYSQQEFVMMLRTGLNPVHVAIDLSAFFIGSPDIFQLGTLHTKQADFSWYNRAPPQTKPDDETSLLTNVKFH